MSIIQERRDEYPLDRIAEQLQFNTFFLVAFVFLLMGAVLALLLPWTWPRRFQSSERRWFFGRAWDDAGSLAEFAFMG